MMRCTVLRSLLPAFVAVVVVVVSRNPPKSPSSAKRPSSVVGRVLCVNRKSPKRELGSWVVAEHEEQKKKIDRCLEQVQVT